MSASHVTATTGNVVVGATDQLTIDRAIDAHDRLTSAKAARKIVAAACT